MKPRILRLFLDPSIWSQGFLDLPGECDIDFNAFAKVAMLKDEEGNPAGWLPGVLAYVILHDEADLTARSPEALQTRPS